MEFNRNSPPRRFQPSPDFDIIIEDQGKILIEPDEMVSFVNEAGKEYDVVAKDWGYYATPSINGRLRREGFKTALVRNTKNMVYLLVVDTDKMNDFLGYIETSKQTILEWLDER